MLSDCYGTPSNVVWRLSGRNSTFYTHRIGRVGGDRSPGALEQGGGQPQTRWRKGASRVEEGEMR